MGVQSIEDEDGGSDPACSSQGNSGETRSLVPVAPAGTAAAAVAAAPHVIVQTQHQSCVQERPDGAREERQLRQCRQQRQYLGGGAETHTEQRDERIKRLRCGKTVVVETVTYQKVSYLP